MVGPTLLDLEITSGGTTDQVSYTLTARSIGNMCGALLCGILFHRVNVWKMYMVLWLIMAVCSSLLPWAHTVYLLGILFFVQGCIHGYVDTAEPRPLPAKPNTFLMESERVTEEWMNELPVDGSFLLCQHFL